MSRKATKPLCFVIMPFLKVKPRHNKYQELDKENLDTIFDLISGILKRSGYEVRRSADPGDILAGIVSNLDRAELVVADLTGLNPNVMYELGIRHGFTKKTILLTQDRDELPFDLKNYHCIEYQWQNKSDKDELGKSIRDTLAKIKMNPDTTYFGPVHSHLGTKRYALREEELRQTAKKAEALFAELGLFMTPLEEAFKNTRELYPDAFVEEDDGWSYNYKDEGTSLDPAASNPFFRAKADELPSAVPALDLIVTTLYFPNDLDFNNQLSVLYNALGSFRYLHIPPTDFTNRTFLSTYSIVLWLRADLHKVIKAIAEGDLGRNLKLRASESYGAKGKEEDKKKAEQKDSLDKK